MIGLNFIDRGNQSYLLAPCLHTCTFTAHHKERWTFHCVLQHRGRKADSRQQLLDDGDTSPMAMDRAAVVMCAMPSLALNICSEFCRSLIADISQCQSCYPTRQAAHMFDTQQTPATAFSSASSLQLDMFSKVFSTPPTSYALSAHCIACC